MPHPTRAESGERPYYIEPAWGRPWEEPGPPRASRQESFSKGQLSQPVQGPVWSLSKGRGRREIPRPARVPSSMGRAFSTFPVFHSRAAQRLGSGREERTARYTVLHGTRYSSVIGITACPPAGGWPGTRRPQASGPPGWPPSLALALPLRANLTASLALDLSPATASRRSQRHLPQHTRESIPPLGLLSPMAAGESARLS